MRRPHKILHRPSGRVRSFGHVESAMRWVCVTAYLPKPYAAEWVYVDPEGVEWPAPTLHTLQLIREVGEALLTQSRAATEAAR